MTITAQQMQQWESETSAMRARITTAENKAYHFQQENERLLAALREIEAAPQPHDDADRTEWKAAFFIAAGLARRAVSPTDEQSKDAEP
jgi:hypothetical protein